jgi:hypothetical protein
MLLIAIAALPGAALAAGRPAAGTWFSGRTSQGKIIRMEAVKGGGLRMGFTEIAKCNRGPDKRNHAIFDRDKPHLRRDGTFDYRKTYLDLPAYKGFPERFDDRQHIVGAFHRGKISGTFDETVTGRKTGLRCTVHLTFDAWRDT